jgi:hypothetical protein
MTERERRNEEAKNRIRRDAEAACEFIDLMESELKQRERMNQDLAQRLDRQEKAA